MNRILYPISKTLLAVVLLLGITGKSFAQMQSYFTATIKSAISQMALSGKTVYVSHVANSPANQYTQAAITNQQGVANFQLPYYGSSGSNVWNVYVVHQGDTMPVDSIYFPSAGYQIGKTYYINDTISPDCNPQVSVQQILGTTLYQFTADTTNFRSCFGWGYLMYGITVDGQFVDTNVVQAGGGINGANVFTIPLSPGTHTVCIQVLSNQNPTMPQTCMAVTVGGVAQNMVMGMVRSNGGPAQENVLVELIGMNGTYRVDSLEWPIDSAFYYFNNVAPGFYYVRATPLGGTNVSTYYQSSLTWFDATPIEVPNLTMPPYPMYHIDLIPFYNSPVGGPNSVQGYINGNSGVTVTTALPGSMGQATTTFTANRTNVLVLNAQNQVVGMATVNPDGTFFIDGLPEGNYTLVIDHPLIANVNRPLSYSSTVHSASIQAVVTTSGFSVVTGKKDNLHHSTVSVFPNPAHNQVFVSNSGELATLKLVNVLGVATELNPTSAINLDGKAPGVYFVKGQTKSGESFNIRLVKQ